MTNPADVLDICDAFNSAVEYIKTVTQFDPLVFTYSRIDQTMTTSNEQGQALLDKFAALGDTNISQLLTRVATHMGTEVKNLQNNRGREYTFPCRTYSGS